MLKETEDYPSPFRQSDRERAKRIEELLDLIANAVRGIPGATWPSEKEKQ